MAGSFGNSDISRNLGLKDLVREIFLDFAYNVIGYIESAVEHCKEDTADLQSGIEVIFNNFNCIYQL